MASGVKYVNIRVQRTVAASDDIIDVNPPTGLQASDRIDGGAGNDTLRLTAAGTMDITQPGTFTNIEILQGSAGDDIFILSNSRLAGVTAINGGTGNDRIQLATGQNDLDLHTVNLTGIERIVGNSADNGIDGSAGDDTIDADEGSDIVHGLAGNDSLTGGLGDDMLYGGAGDDQLIGADNTDGEDLLVGGAGNDTYYVDGLDDWINETDDGGAGIDTIVANETSYDLRNAQITGEVENLTLTGNRNVNGFGTLRSNVLTGNSGNNKLYGYDGNDTLNGGAGADRLEGGTGDDRLDGGTGNDVMTGGKGADFFVFSTALNGTTNVDKITDFFDVEDTIKLDDAVFTAIGPAGFLAGTAFAANLTGAATSATQRIIYETDTGKLFYDADGNGQGAAIQFAELAPNLRNLSYRDFLIY